MKTYEWTAVFDGEAHTVVLKFSRLTGRTLISINGSEFNISHSPFYYLKERREIFRIAEEKQAILVIPTFGAPDIVVDRKFVGSGKPYV